MRRRETRQDKMGEGTERGKNYLFGSDWSVHRLHVKVETHADEEEQIVAATRGSGHHLAERG